MVDRTRISLEKLPRRVSARGSLLTEPLKNPHNPLILSSNPSTLPLGGTHNLAQEILMGNDESLEANEFMSGGALMAEVLDVNGAMERSRGI